MIGREKPGEQSEVAQLIQQTLEQERWQREMMEQRYNQYMEEQEVSLYAVIFKTFWNKEHWCRIQCEQNKKTTWFVILESAVVQCLHMHSA